MIKSRLKLNYQAIKGQLIELKYDRKEYASRMFELKELKLLAHCRKVLGIDKTIELFERNGISQETTKLMLKELNNRDCKNYRIREHMFYMYLNRNYHYFLTFTFNDKSLQLSYDTRRQKVRRTLLEIKKRYDGLYIANIDFGSENEREHYHAFISLDSECKNLTSELQSLYDYGFIKVCSANTNIGALSKYINKLSNHAMKDSTRNQNLIYSDGFGQELNAHKKRCSTYHDLAATMRNIKRNLIEKNYALYGKKNLSKTQ